jgi:50S ribosomal subunit-associated GTPase HflX
VLNKRDKLTEEGCASVVAEVRRDLGVEPLVISTRSPADVAHVRAEIIAHFDGAFVDGSLFVPYAEHALVHAVRKEAQIVSERHDADGTHLALRAPKGVLLRLGASLSE